MTDPDPARDAGDAGIHPSEEALAAFLDGALPEAQAADVEHHLVSCRDCRALVAGTARVLDAPSEPVRAAPPRRPWRRVALALAASIAVILLARPAAPPAPSGAVRAGPGDVAGEGLGILAVHAPPPGDTVQPRGVTFSWGASSAERYRLVVASEDGTPVWTADTRDTTIALPDSVALRPGALYFWHADAVSGGLAATTRMQRFTVAP